MHNIIASTRLLRNILIDCGIPQIKIIHSDNGYALSIGERFEGKERAKLVFSFAGRVVTLKPVNVLVRGYDMISREDLELMIQRTYFPRSRVGAELRPK